MPKEKIGKAIKASSSYLPYPLLNTSLADFPKSLYDGGIAIGSETWEAVRILPETA